MLKWMFAGCVLLSGTGALAADNCPSFRPGQYYPWQLSSDKPMAGDQWAWLYIDVDVNGVS